MIVKNTTASNISINKSVQIDVNTPNVNDGYVLPSQILDLSKSLNMLDLSTSQELEESILSGDLILVVDGVEMDTTDSIRIYESGSVQWSKIFNPIVSQDNLFEGIASGFIYAKNCLIG